MCWEFVALAGKFHCPGRRDSENITQGSGVRQISRRETKNRAGMRMQGTTMRKCTTVDAGTVT
ncbi:hypothetical protein GCM10009784_29190 [Arthrobacter parietis]|uniref:Uncharacterized protein n=1 Tax=Arthrobacter parietis TaxID=271434 RepID=A0ABN3B1D8_9MICC